MGSNGPQMTNTSSRLLSLILSSRSSFSATVLFFLFILLYFLLLTFDFAIEDLAYRSHYLSIHTLLELAAVLPSFAIFTLGSATIQSVRKKSIILLSAFSLCAAFLDIGHILSYPGMPNFVSPSSADKGIYFWLASRLTDSVSFFIVAVLSLKQEFEMSSTSLSRMSRISFPAAIFYTLFAYYIILGFPQYLPDMFVDGEGLTTLKVSLEMLVGVLTFVTGILFLKKALREDGKTAEVFYGLALGAFIFCLGSFCFLSYSTIDDRFNLLGHLLKAAAMFLILRSVFIECVFLPLQYTQSLALKAEAAKTAKTKFLASVSHELRTPLGIISGYSELLQSRLVDAENKSWAESIYRNVSQLRLLIDDFLDLVKMENQKLSISPSSFDISTFLSDLKDAFNMLSSEKGLKFTIENELPSDYKLSTDYYRLKQILDNLISNAIKFTDEGDIVLRVFSGKDSIYFSVKDSGQGIPEEGQENLFQPFSQLHQEYGKSHGGTGLGLAISKNLANLLGGDLTLVSSKINEGSEFLLRIEKNVHDAISKSAIELSSLRITPEPAVPDFSEKNVLVVDDNKENLVLLDIFLKPTNADVVCVSSGPEALDKLADQSFNIILMDIQMPEMSGFETIERIRAQGIKTPVVAVSAHALEEEKQRAIQVGFDDYCSKPIDVSHLLQSMQKLL